MKALILAAAILAAAAAAGAQELRRSGFVGIVAAAVPDETRTAMALPAGVGVLVTSTVATGSARAAGIRADDVITAIDGRGVMGVADFVGRVRLLRAGDTVGVTLRRGGATLSLDVPVKPRPYEAAPDVDVRYDAVRVDGSLRRTIVTAPKTPGRHPAILYLNGIGCFSQESLDLTSNDAQLLYGLTRRGYVTMRLEKSGMGDSGGPACDSPGADFDAEVRSYTAAVRALEQYDFVDAGEVVLLGLSIGGVEAPLVAARERVRAVAVVNTVARPLFEYLIDTWRRQLTLARTPPEEADRRMQQDLRCNGPLLIDKKTPEAIVAADRACADVVTYPAPYTFMQQWADVNPSAAWSKLDVPVCIVNGSSDFIATAADHPYLASVINAARPGAATLEIVPQMDHGLSKAATMEESFNRTGAAQFQPAVVSTLAAWLDGITRG